MVLEHNFDAVFIQKSKNGEYEIQEITPKNGTNFTLEELQEYVGGYIEIVCCNNPEYIAIIDEEGKLKGKGVNYLATHLIHTVISKEDYLVGNVVFCKSSLVN